MKNDILSIFLDALSVKHTPVYCAKALEAEPFSDSLYGIAVLLERFNVDNSCVRFNDKASLDNTSCPFLCIIEGAFSVVTSVEASGVELISASGKKSNLPYNAFLEKWNGVALLASKNSSSEEPDYRNNLRKQRISDVKSIIFVISIVALIVAGIVMNPLKGSPVMWIPMAIDAAGIYVSFLLLQKQLHIHNPVADRLCGLIKESGCDKVADSAPEGLFGIVSFSEIGMGFFSVGFVASVFFPASAFFLAITAVAVLPFTFWSLWFQKFRARSWCALCLCALLLMWLQAAALSAFGAFSMPSYGLPALIGLWGGYAAVILAVNRLMDSLRRMRNGVASERKYNSLRTRDEVIEAIEAGKPVYDTGTEVCTSIVFGNPDAKRSITVFSNPYCGPCAAMHRRMENMPGKNLCIRYVMTAFSEQKATVNRLFISAYRKLGAERTWRLMSEWFEGGKMMGADFFDGLGLDPEEKDVLAEYEKHRKWRDNTNPAGTPTVMVNGRELVSPYSVEDYIYMPLSV